MTDKSLKARIAFALAGLLLTAAAVCAEPETREAGGHAIAHEHASGDAQPSRARANNEIAIGRPVSIGTANDGADRQSLRDKRAETATAMVGDDTGGEQSQTHDEPETSHTVLPGGLNGSDGPDEPADDHARIPDVLPQEEQGLGEPQGLLGSFGRLGEEREIGRGISDGRDADTGGWMALPGGDFMQVASALALVIGLLMIVRTIMVRAGAGLGAAGRPSGVMEVLARYPIARGQQLVLLKLARRIVLVHQSGSGMTTLSEVTEPDEVANLLARIEAGTRGRESARFRSMLDQFNREHETIEVESAAAKHQPGHSPAERLARTHESDEIIDLTRSAGMNPFRGLTRLLGRKGEIR